MVELGVGKNMVRSIRFWSQAAGVVESLGKNGKLQLTSFGKTLLGNRGFDPFLEDIRTLWLIHWKLATSTPNPLLAWDFLLNCWQEPEIIPSTVVAALQKEITKHNEKASPSTLEQHFDTFLHTYVPTRGRKGRVQEDNLDCPLVELALIIKVSEGESNGALGRRESIYAFRAKRSRRSLKSYLSILVEVGRLLDSKEPEENAVLDLVVKVNASVITNGRSSGLLIIIDESIWPQPMEVDYVRVYQQHTSGSGDSWHGRR